MIDLDYQQGALLKHHQQASSTARKSPVATVRLRLGLTLPVMTAQIELRQMVEKWLAEVQSLSRRGTAKEFAEVQSLGDRRTVEQTTAESMIVKRTAAGDFAEESKAVQLADYSVRELWAVKGDRTDVLASDLAVWHESQVPAGRYHLAILHH